MFIQKNGGYWQNLHGIFAKNGPARPSWNSGPTSPARPSPLKFVPGPICQAWDLQPCCIPYNYIILELDESRDSIGGNSLAMSYRPTVFVKPKNLDQLEISNDKEDITAHQATKVKFLDAVDWNKPVVGMILIH